MKWGKARADIAGNLIAQMLGRRWIQFWSIGPLTVIWECADEEGDCYADE